VAPSFAKPTNSSIANAQHNIDGLQVVLLAQHGRPHQDIARDLGARPVVAMGAALMTAVPAATTVFFGFYLWGLDLVFSRVLSQVLKR
jgi:hypothetical protein